MLIARSDTGLTVVTTVAVLLTKFRSASLATTAARLVTGPETVGMLIMLSAAQPWLVRLPKSQITWPLATVQLPWLFVSDTKATVEGSVLVNLTPVAVSGPRFVTRIV